MLLFEHKQHLQSYDSQSSMQNEIYSFKEFSVQGLQQASSRVGDITNPKIYINPAPENTQQRGEAMLL